MSSHILAASVLLKILPSPRVLVVALCLLMLSSVSFGQETVEMHPKVVMLFDVSASMNTIDELPAPNQDPDTLLSRQDHILRFLSSKGKKASPFLDQILQKAKVTAYRFGATLDALDAAEFEPGKTWTPEQWARWLKSDGPIDDLRAGTNIAGSALHMLHREQNEYLQAILIFSDGRSNRSTAKEIDEFLTRVQDAKRPVPVFTIGIGEARQPILIRVDDLYAPEQARSDAPFPVRVPVRSTRLHDEEFTVSLHVTRVKDVTGTPVKDKTYVLAEKKGRFKGAGDHPQDIVEFEIDVQALAGIKAQDDKNNALEGEWHIVARVPRHPKEAFAKTEHVALPVRVQVQNHPLRVLLFAGSATREYQFVRNLLIREMKEKRLEVSILNQQSNKDEPADEGVDRERVLTSFPNKLGLNDAGKKYMSLSDYDVIVAFDPDWSKLSGKQLKLLEEWVGTHAGGVVFVPGPVYTYQVARPGGLQLNDLLKIFPVVLKDARLHGLGGLGLDRSRPYALNFGRAAKQFGFLKLDEAHDSAIAGWNGFFWNNERFEPEPGKDPIPRRGFYDCYPVYQLKPDSQVIATFAGPKESRINDGKDEQPFIVSMRYGAGKTLYLGSGEFWRLRSYKAGYHERFWINVLRYTAGTVAPPKKTARIHMSRIIVRRSWAEVELDDVRADFGQLHHLASPAEPVLGKRPAELRKDIEAALRRSAAFPDAPAKDALRLFFRLSDAQLIPACLEKLPARQVPKNQLPPKEPEGGNPFKSILGEKKVTKVLIIDGEGPAGRKEPGDSFFIKAAISSVPGQSFEVLFGDELARGDSVKALEQDLAEFGVILLLNVRELGDKQLAQLEKYSKAGGGIAFFLGPRVNSDYYNRHLFKAGKGLFPVPLQAIYHPGPNDPPLKRELQGEEQLLLRDDLFPDADKYPIFGELFSHRPLRVILQDLTIKRYFQVRRKQWQPEAGRSFELATLPNLQSCIAYQEAVLALSRGETMKKIQEDEKYKQYAPALAHHRNIIETLVSPGSEKKAFHLAKALDDMLLGQGKSSNLTAFWKLPDAKVRSLLEDVIRLRHQARHGDPLVLGGQFGKGRVVAVLTTAGKEWNDFAAGSQASIMYAPFIWEMVKYLSSREEPEKSKEKPRSQNDRPQMLDVDLDYTARKAADKDFTKEFEATYYLVTPDVLLPFRGTIADDAGLIQAHWVVQVHPVELVDKKIGKLLPPQPEQQIPLPVFRAKQDQRAIDELMRNVLGGIKNKPLPGGIARTHSLREEERFDFRRYLPRLKAKQDEAQMPYLVKLRIVATNSQEKIGTSRTFLLLVVSENEMLFQVSRGGSKILDRLETARDKVQQAQLMLGEQIDKLKALDADRSLIAVRVEQIRTSVDDLASVTRTVQAEFDSILRELAINRIKKDSLTRMQPMIASLEGTVSRAGDSLRKVSTLLEKGKADVIKLAQTARADLNRLDEEMTQVLNMGSEWIVETRLIELLRQIEMEQRKNQLRLESLHRESVIGPLRELLQKVEQEK